MIVSGCTRSNSESKNIEQIYAEEGVPVRTITVTTASFETGYKYNARLNGIRESSAYAAVSDKVDAIHVEVGDYVEKDSVLVTFPTDNPSAQYYQAKTTFENARATFDRMSNYYESGGLSAQLELKDSRVVLDQATVAHHAAVYEYLVSEFATTE
ncbi:MAG: hypothetical protein KAU36_03205 [candidate division Zixibacteria bacterium]|nr:hypothetical protein [candidate division Zixibacteria bacterium]